MGIFLVKLNNLAEIRKNNFVSDILVPQSSILFFFIEESEKIYGIYEVEKINQSKNKWQIFFSRKFKFRRGIEYKLLKQYNIKFSLKKSIYKINKKKFRILYQILNEINFPQLASDIVLFELKEDNCYIKYFQSYPEVKVLSESIKLDKKYIIDLSHQIEVEIKSAKESENFILNLQKFGFKLFTIFKKSKIFSSIKSGRDLCVLLENEMSILPIEVIFDGYRFFSEKYNISHSFFISSESFDPFPMSDFHNDVSIVVPRYKDTKFDFKKIYKLFISKSSKIVVYNKKLKNKEFTKICENSRILYFAGHTVFNRQKREFGLKIGDDKLFYLSDFQYCVRLPFLIMFHSCFENKFFHYTERALSKLFIYGVKNIVIPIMEVPMKSEGFIENFVKNLTEGNKIGESFRLVINNAIKKGWNDWIYFRLYGDPKMKYF